MFTTKDDIARFTARVALDEGSPRVVEIAGDRVTPPQPGRHDGSTDREVLSRRSGQIRERASGGEQARQARHGLR